jgi:signal transduction histidine kinase
VGNRSPQQVFPSAVPVVSGRENLDRVLRMLARLVSIGYIGYLVLLMPAFLGQSDRLDLWWTPAAVVVVFGCGVLPGLFSFRPDTRLLRACASAAAVAFLLAVITWPLAWNGPDLPAGDAVWLATFPGLASLTAIIAWPIWLTFTHLIAGCVGTMAITTAARGGSSLWMLPTEIAFAIMFCTLFAGAAAMAIRTGKLLDATTETTHQAAAEAAAQHARTVEGERFHALIHDRVISTFLAVGRGEPQSIVGPLAACTLAELDALRSPTGSVRPFSVDEAIAHLRAAAAHADDRATFDVHRAADAGPEKLSSESVRTVGAALTEALRNSRLHAGEGARRSVTVLFSDTHLRVDVTDDGAGFDPTAVAPHRLGIAVSILGRMRSLRGGTAYVQSSPGCGTQIHLEWLIR